MAPNNRQVLAGPACYSTMWRVAWLSQEPQQGRQSCCRLVSLLFAGTPDKGADPAAGDIVPRLLAAPTSRAVEATEAAAGDQAASSRPQTTAQQQVGQPKGRAAHSSGEDHGQPRLAGHATTVSPEEPAPPSRFQQLWRGLSRPRDKSTAALSVDTETAASTSTAAASTAEIESSTPDPVSDELGSALVLATMAGNQDAAKSGILEMEASREPQKQASVQGRAGQAWGASLWGAAGKLLPWRASWPRSAMSCTQRGHYGCPAFHSGLHSRVLHAGASCCGQARGGPPGRAWQCNAQKWQALEYHGSRLQQYAAAARCWHAAS